MYTLSSLFTLVGESSVVTPRSFSLL